MKFVYAASGILARQVENGAPFDVFLSASKAYVVGLAAKGHIRPDSVGVYAHGRLGLWSTGRAFKDLKALSSASRISIANPQHAPYGLAAQQALQTAGLWDKLKDKLVLAENARQALQFATSGNVDAAITSWSLVARQQGVAVPESLHAPIEQACGIVASTRQLDAARAYLDFLKGPEGAKILERHGLRPVTGKTK